MQYFRIGSSMCAFLLLTFGIGTATHAYTHYPADSNALRDVLAGVTTPALAQGDTIVLAAGTTYTASPGGFILREVGPPTGTSYITIQSSAMSSLPPAGERVKPIHAAHMPKIRAANLTNERTLRTALPPQVAHHYKLVGLEIIGPANNAQNVHGLIEIGVNASSQNTDQLVPHHITIDRCYIHDNSATQTVQLGVALHGKQVDIINSHISGIKYGSGEAKAIHGANGPGPFNIINNYLEASSMSIFFGGVQNHIQNMTPSNILVQRNHMYKPESWKTDPGNWWVKNIFELKCGVNVTLDSNILENCWADAGQQYGAAIVLKTVQNSDGSSWYTTQNVTITNNIVRNVGQGVVIAGSRTPQNTNLFGLPDTVTIRNNLFVDVKGTNLVTGNRGWLFQFGSSSPNITIDHNTGFQFGGGAAGTSSADRVIEAGDGGVDHPNFVYKNNLTQYINGGIRGSGFPSSDEGALASYFPGCTYQKNVLTGGTLANYDPNYLGGWSNPSNAFPTNWSGVLVGSGSPGVNYAGYKVVDGSPWDGAGTDGKDIGCDIDQITAATAGCISGVWGTPPAGGTLLEDFANSTDYWGGAYTGLTADDVISGGKLIFVSNGSGGSLLVSSQHKHNGENISGASVWTTGDFSGQSYTRLTFTAKNNGTGTLTASNFAGAQDYFAISCKKNSTSGNLASNRAMWNLSNILFANQSSIAPGQTVTVSVPFASPNSWLTTGIANQYGMDPANDRYIFAGFRFSVGSGNGAKTLEIDELRIQP